MYGSNRLCRLLSCLLLASACHQKLHVEGDENEAGDMLARKAAPTDFYAAQRAWPDSSFDVLAWRTALDAARADATVAAQINSCGSNIGNWTSQGPGNVGGRCNTLAVKPGDDFTVLAGFAGGGIFKSTDGGVNWKPVFDAHPETSIGDITYDPSNPNVVYAGTGDPNMPSFIFNGNGLYKSTDGGEVWEQIGLAEQGIISKVWVSPTDPQTLVCATMGNPYVRTQERGIFKSTDGGQTWQRTLFVSEQSGASDLVSSPAAPNVLYASFWDRIRNNQESILYGPAASVWKSTDSGSTWVKLGGGLPTGVNGRTGLAISETDPNKVFALFIDTLSTPLGLYKSTDAGQTWASVNISALNDAVGDFGWYFGKIRLLPTNDEEVYFLGILQWKRITNGSGWQVTGNGHADSHDLLITPSGRRYWANDGGVYYALPGQAFYTKCKNLPITQFYRANYNPHEPNLYWGGAQDNGIKKGNAASFNAWTSVFSADGFHAAFDPNDPQRFWVEIQNGQLYATTNGGVDWTQAPPAFGTGDRCSWDAPFFRSTHTGTFYAATYRALSSPDGSGWGPLSPDLSDGIIYGPRFHLVSSLSESPLLPNLLFAGTSDANVWRGQGGNWTNITGSLPNRYVTSVIGSPTLSNRIFVTHSGLRYDEYIPHVHRSDNNGATWVDISGNLPQVPVNDLFVVKNHADSILVAATDAGAYYTQNGGVTWARLGANMPFVPVFDLIENPVRKELVAATFARGIWTFPLDSIRWQQSSPTVSLSGTIRNDQGQPVAQTSILGQVTPANGTFQAANLPGCANYTLAPKRDDAPLNGVSTLDLVRISKHILGIQPLDNPYRMIAADANVSGSVTTFDIVELRKLILGVYDTLPKPDSWRFVPSDFVFPNPQNPFQATFPETKTVNVQQVGASALDFTGIKVGDADGSASPTLTGQSSEERDLPTREIRVEDLFVAEGKSFEVSVTTDLSDLAAAQFTLHFDPALLALEGVDGQDPAHFNLAGAASGWISFASEAVLPQAGSSDRLFTLRFRALRGGSSAASIRLGDSPTEAVLFDKKDRAYRPVFRGSERKATVSPNPFGDAGTRLRVENAAQPFVLEIWDVQGRPVHRYAGEGGQAATELHLPARIFPQKGIFPYKITLNGERSAGYTGKMMFGL
jgi:photosystem II stability/assembly factor-like uncharacterized protein